ncbi:TPA: phage tail protein [Neisseria weaveri]
MANLNETATWEAGIYQWETSDPVQGGPNGIDNKPTRQLANRTLWLKTELAKAVASIGKNKTDGENMFARKTTNLTAGAGLTGGGTLGGNMQFALGTPGTCSGNTTNWAGSNTHTHQLAAASPTVAGVAKLINNLTTDDAESAASAAMVKKLNEEKVSKTGNEEIGGEKTFTSLLTAGRAEHWGKIRMPVQGGGHWFLEANPQSNLADGATLKFNIKYEQESGQVRYIHFPELGSANRTVAYQDWVIARIAGVESSAVKTAGNQSIAGKKTFSESADFSRGLRLSGNNQDQWAELGYAASAVYLKNPASNKSLQLGDDGTIKYQGDKLVLWSDRRDAVDLANSQTVATSQAVKTVNDKAEQAAPPGAVAYFAGANPPPGWLKANGAAVSRTTYAALFAAIGTTYGAGDGRNTFNLPDLRGEFVRGLDDGRGIDSGRALGSRQIGTVVGADSQDGAATIGVAIAGIKSNYAQTAGSLGMDTVDMSDYSNARLVWSGGRQSGLQAANPDGNGHFSGVARPRNIALLACIKI